MQNMWYHLTYSSLIELSYFQKNSFWKKHLTNNWQIILTVDSFYQLWVNPFTKIDMPHWCYQPPPPPPPPKTPNLWHMQVILIYFIHNNGTITIFLRKSKFVHLEKPGDIPLQWWKIFVFALRKWVRCCKLKGVEHWQKYFCMNFTKTVWN